MEIAQLGQPVLRKVCKEVSVEAIDSPEFQTFVDEMLQTLSQAGGVGLAAPQVFRDIRVFLAAIIPPKSEEGSEEGSEEESEEGSEEESPGVEIFVNPRIEVLSDEKESKWEGCLSFSELLVLVPRASKIRIEYSDRTGRPKTLEASDFPARVIQHEYDHLDGILTIDRAQSTHHIIKASEIDVFEEDEE